ncbi:MAG: class I SAM-dependent methyltransferase [Halarsenatibacteraceae bacterium]
MAFYQEFNRYYDDIFPVKPGKVEFLKDSFAELPDGASLLDIGCGTGGYTIEMRQEGFKPIGIDYELAMLDLARDKTAAEDLSIEYKKLDMRDLALFYSKPYFYGVYSLGNVMVHLSNEQEISTMIKKIHQVMHPGGKLVTQIVNYDRVIDNEVDSLPTITNEEAGVEFIRNYDRKEDGRIDFKTELIVNKGTDEEEKYRNSVPLYPLRSGDFISLLEDSGFAEIEKFGDFQGGKFKPGESFPLIVRAKKS